MAQSMLITLPSHNDHRGGLSFTENTKLPFDIKGTWWYYNLSDQAFVEATAYRDADILLIALFGSFTITTDNGCISKQEILNSPNQGLYIPAGIWHRLEFMSTTAVLLVLSSKRYEDCKEASCYQKLKQ